MTLTSITLPSELLEELKNLFGTDSNTEAVIIAIKDKIRAIRTEKIKNLSGKLEFIDTAEKIRHKDHRLG